MTSTVRASKPLPAWWLMPPMSPDELVSRNGLSDQMAAVLDDYPSMDYESNLDYHVVGEIAYTNFLRRHSLRYSPRSLCVHALLNANGLPKGQASCWRSSRVDHFCSAERRYSIDHNDRFTVRTGSPQDTRRMDMWTTEPYPTRDLSKRVEELAERAVEDGLELWVSPRQSWHLPGRSILVAAVRSGVWRPA